MMGRIPILINTDCVFPLEDKINIQELGLIVEKKDKDKIVEVIKDYFNNNSKRFLEIQKNNRKLWENYFSPIGFIKNGILHSNK